jgi:hypothetical protein
VAAITIIAGNTVKSGEIVFTLRGGGAVQSLAGCTLTMRSRLRSAPEGTAAATRSMAMLDAAAGAATFTMTAAETSALALGEHLVQIDVTFGDGSLWTWPTVGSASFTVVPRI